MLPSDPTAPSPIPQSPALAEAKIDSLSELFARDPEGYNDQDLDRVIAALREQRARQEAMEAQGKAPRAKAPSKAVSLSARANPEDLGL